MTALPALFVSHGAPTLVQTDTPANRFLRDLGRRWPRPEAILVASAHWETREPAVDVDKTPRTIHDFYGFPDQLYELRYPAPGATAVAHEAADLLERAGLGPVGRQIRGLDHGAWVPLLLAYPAADIPVAQIAVQPTRDAAHHRRVGTALRPLRERGVLIVGSGSATHNLSELRRDEPGAPAAPWSDAFADWVAEAVTAGRLDDLLEWQRRAPSAARNHPTPEHFLPFFVALGAGGEDIAGERVHTSTEYATLRMDAYVFQ
jgi:4,5-DOPA dioxygenase extradiol